MARNPRAFAAPVVQSGPVPAYTVFEHPHPVEKEIAEFDEKTRTIVKKTVQITGGYMVHFPKGHSAFYESLEALEDAGLGEVVPLISMSGNAESEVNKEHDGLGPVAQRVIGKAK